MDKLQNLISHYVLDREQLTCLFVLIDIRHEPQKKDMAFLDFIGENGIPFAIIFTKADKITKAKQTTNLEAYIAHLKQQWEELPPYFLTSSASKQGREEVLNYIEEINNSLANPD